MAFIFCHNCDRQMPCKALDAISLGWLRKLIHSECEVWTCPGCTSRKAAA